MTLVINNADTNLLQMLNAINQVSKKKYEFYADDEYPQELIDGIKNDELDIENQKKNGTLRVFDSAEEAFANL